MSEMNCKLQIGLDGHTYLVFADEEQAETAVRVFNLDYVCFSSCNGYLNAIRINKEKE